MEAALTVNVDVGGLTLDAVVGTHTVWVAGGEDWEPYREEQPMTLLDAVVDRLVQGLLTDSTVVGAVRKVRDEVVKELVGDAVRTALAEPFTPTTAYGEQAGEPTTLRGVIVQLAEKALTLRVKREGYSQSTPETLAELVIRQGVDSALVKELKAAVDAERAKVVAAMREQGAALIARMLEAGLPNVR
jgi:hypothetical protein